LREIGKVVRYLPDKKNKISPVCPALAFARIEPKICQGRPSTMYSECSRFHPYRFTFGEFLAERMNTVETAVKWIQYSAEAYLRPNRKYRPNVFEKATY